MTDYKRGDLVLVNSAGPFEIHSYTHYSGGKMYWIMGASGDLCGPFFDKDLLPLDYMIADDSYRLPAYESPNEVQVKYDIIKDSLVPTYSVGLQYYLDNGYHITDCYTDNKVIVHTLRKNQ